jgi:hypothetical protein
VSHLPAVSSSKMANELAWLLTSLQQTIQQLHRPPTVVPYKCKTLLEILFGISRVAIGRTMEGRFICDFCSKTGHKDSRCFQNPYFRGQEFQSQQMDRRDQPIVNNQQGLSGPRRNVQPWPVNNVQKMPSENPQNSSAYPVIILIFLSQTSAFSKRPIVSLPHQQLLYLEPVITLRVIPELCCPIRLA